MESKDKKAQLLDLIRRRAVFKGDYMLSSGKRSSYYIDMRLVTLSAEGAYLIAEVLYDELAGTRFDAIGGLTIGADPIASAYAALSFARGRPADAFIVRKEEKSHGKGRSIEGPLKKGSSVVIVDDVATSGGSLIKALDALEQEGCSVVKALVLVDRVEGARERLAKKGVSLASLYSKQDLGISP